MNSDRVKTLSGGYSAISHASFLDMCTGLCERYSWYAQICHRTVGTRKREPITIFPMHITCTHGRNSASACVMDFIQLRVGAFRRAHQCASSSSSLFFCWLVVCEAYTYFWSDTPTDDDDEFVFSVQSVGGVLFVRLHRVNHIDNRIPGMCWCYFKTCAMLTRGNYVVCIQTHSRTRTHARYKWIQPVRMCTDYVVAMLLYDDVSPDCWWKRNQLAKFRFRWNFLFPVATQRDDDDDDRMRR